MPLDVRASPQLAAVILSLEQADRTLRADINATARRTLGPVWQQALTEQASTRLERRTLLPGAKVKVSAKQVTLVAAASRRPLSGGLVPAVQWPGVELGYNARRQAVQLRSPRGRAYQAKRMQGRQFRKRSKGGYVVFPAAGVAGHAIVAGWVHVVIAGFEADWDVHR